MYENELPKIAKMTKMKNSWQRQHQQQSKHNKITNVVIWNTCFWWTHIFITGKHKSTLMFDVADNECMASVLGVIANLIMLLTFWLFKLSSWQCNYYIFLFYREHKNNPLLSWDENRGDVCPFWIVWVTVHKSHIVPSKQQLLVKLWFYQVTFWKEITVFVHVKNFPNNSDKLTTTCPVTLWFKHANYLPRFEIVRKKIQTFLFFLILI